VRGQSRTFTFAATDASAVDQAGMFTYAINWGDGSLLQTVSGSSNVNVDHVFTASGNFTVRVIATDKDGGASVAATRNVTISNVALQGTTLVVGGTLAGDTIILTPNGSGISVGIAGVNQGTFPASQIQIFGQAGGDTITLSQVKVKNTNTYITVPAIIDGGAGEDTIDVRGSTANNVLLGGDGRDLLYAGAGRDLLIGGLGADVLRAGGGDDILIGGTTAFDANFAALSSLIAEWGRTNLGYSARVDHLTGATSGGLNGSNLLTASTVFDDAAVDELYGEGNQDWFLYGSSGANRDVLRDRKSNERTTTV
jgi:Ca2+-binding RTX toxin-like protein